MARPCSDGSATQDAADAKGAERGARVLVIDDDPGLLDLIEMRLAAAGYAVIRAASGQEALERFRAERPRVVICDLRMDGMDGHTVFAHLHAEAPTVPVIMLTAHGTIPDAVAATQRGVFGFLTKPFDGRELLGKVAEAMVVSPCVATATGAAGQWRAGIISTSLVMEELLRQARRAADADEPALICGPPGSGKESLARAIHAASPRAKGPFVVLKCATRTTSGERAPALSDALANAHGGVLFLADIDDLPASDQAHLLPWVQERGIFSMPRRKSASDVRVIAATSRTLDPAIRDGSFRSDLFYALGRLTLDVPPLAERRDDIPALIAKFVADHQGAAQGFTPEALMALHEAHWPGNVRQLHSIVAQSLARSVTPQVPATLVRQLLREEAERDTAAFDEARREFEHDYLVQLLTTTRGSVTRAARVAKRNRTEFYKLLARHNIDPSSYK